MITPVTMHNAICDFLEKEVASRYTLKATDSNGNEYFRKPNVIRSGWILPRSADAHIAVDNYDDGEYANNLVAIKHEYPFILPRIAKVEHIQEQIESIVTLDVLFGVYGPGQYDEKGTRINDGNGYRDLWNLIEATRQALFERHTIDNRYRLLLDFFEADTAEEWVYPYWEGRCTTKWHVMFPVPQKHPNFF